MATSKKNRRQYADRLWATFIKRRGACQHPCAQCGGRLEAAHIVPRRFFSTRWDSANGVALCHNCHYYFTNHEAAWRKWIGDKYDALWDKAQEVWDKDYDRVVGELNELRKRK